MKKNKKTKKKNMTKKNFKKNSNNELEEKTIRWLA